MVTTLMTLQDTGEDQQKLKEGCKKSLQPKRRDIKKVVLGSDPVSVLLEIS